MMGIWKTRDTEEYYKCQYHAVNTRVLMRESISATIQFGKPIIATEELRGNEKHRETIEIV